MNGLSNHNGQIILINGEEANSNLQLQKCNRLIDEEIIKQFKYYLRREKWESTYHSGNMEDKFNSFHNTFLQIFETGFSPKMQK
jgi:hypothetical protein